MTPYAQLPPYYAQWEEDSWLATHRLIPTRGTFVDIGAGDGVRGSNSLYFENLGWTGLAVDPDPRNADALTARRCTTSTLAIAATAGRRPFGMYAHKPSWSGLERHGPDYAPVIVDCAPLETLLSDLAIGDIDLLSIDVEGTELDVWSSIDHTHHACRIVIIEYDDRHPDRSREHIHRQLGTDRYQIIHRTPANLILEFRTNAWQSTCP